MRTALTIAAGVAATAALALSATSARADDGWKDAAAWSTDYEATVARAKRDGKVVFGLFTRPG